MDYFLLFLSEYFQDYCYGGRTCIQYLAWTEVTSRAAETGVDISYLPSNKYYCTHNHALKNH